MAVRKPLYWSTSGLQGAGLKELSDADLEVMSYYLRKAYADLLYEKRLEFYTVAGLITRYYTTNMEHIGSAEDIRRRPAVKFELNNNDDLPAPGDDLIPTNIAEESVDYSNSSTYNYYQNRTKPNRPNATVLNSNSYLHYNDGLKFLGYPVNTTGDEDVIDTIIKDCKQQMYNGDQLASYRIATTTPTNGNASGTWSRIMTFFSDTTYNYIPNLVSAVDTYLIENKYNLYLKTSLDEPPTPTISKIYTYDSTLGGLNTMNYDENSNLVQNVLLPHMLRNFPLYEVSTTKPSILEYDSNRGQIIDTHFSGTDSYGIPIYIDNTGTATTYGRLDIPAPTFSTGYSAISRKVYYLRMYI